MTDSSAHDALLAALDTRDVQTIQEAMASYADAVQGVQLQSAAFELVARVNEAKGAEIDTLIAEMRQLASKNPASMRSLGSPPAMPPPPQPAQIDREPPSPAAAVAAAAAAPEPSELRVTVHSPELVTSTLLKSHHVYRVEVQAENLSVPTCSVGRRFSDFDWLQLRLREEYPGVVVPPLPEKQGLVDVAAQEVLQASGVQDDDDSWLEQRCTALGRMLRRIYAHPLLGGSPSLQAFLEANDQGFAHFKEEAAALDNKGVEALAGLVGGGGVACWAGKGCWAGSSPGADQRRRPRRPTPRARGCAHVLTRSTSTRPRCTATARSAPASSSCVRGLWPTWGRRCRTWGGRSSARTRRRRRPTPRPPLRSWRAR